MEFREVTTVKAVLIATLLTGLSGKPFPAVNEGRSLHFEGDKSYNLDKSVLAKILNNKHISTANYRNIFKITIPLNAHTPQTTQKIYRDVNLSKNAEIPKIYIRHNLIPLLKSLDYINHAFKTETNSQQKSEVEHTGSELGRLHARFQSNKSKRGGKQEQQPDEKQETVIPATVTNFTKTTSTKNSKEASYTTTDYESSNGPSNAVSLLLERSTNNSERDVSRVIQGSYSTRNENFQRGVTGDNRDSQPNTRSVPTETSTGSYEKYTTGSSQNREHSFDGTRNSEVRNNRFNDFSGEAHSARYGRIVSPTKTEFTDKHLENEVGETKSGTEQIENGRSQEFTKLEVERGLGVFITSPELDHTESYNFLGSISTGSERLFSRNGLSAYKNKGDSPKPRSSPLSYMNNKKLLPVDTTSQATTEELLVGDVANSFESTTTTYQTPQLPESVNEKDVNPLREVLKAESETTITSMVQNDSDISDNVDSLLESSVNPEDDDLEEELQAMSDSTKTKLFKHENDSRNNVEKITRISKSNVVELTKNGSEHIFTSDTKGHVSFPSLEQIWNMSTSHEIPQLVEISSGYSNLLLASNGSRETTKLVQNYNDSSGLNGHNVESLHESDVKPKADALVEVLQATSDSTTTKLVRHESDSRNNVEKTTRILKSNVVEPRKNGSEHIFTSDIKSNVSTPTLEQIWNMSTSHEISQPVEISSGYSNLLLASNGNRVTATLVQYGDTSDNVESLHESDVNPKADNLEEVLQAKSDSTTTELVRNESDKRNNVEITTEFSKSSLAEHTNNGPEHIFTSDIKGDVSTHTLEQICSTNTSHEISQPVEISSGYSNLILANNGSRKTTKLVQNESDTNGNVELLQVRNVNPEDDELEDVLETMSDSTTTELVRNESDRRNNVEMTTEFLKSSVVEHTNNGPEHIFTSDIKGDVSSPTLEQI